MIITMMTVHPSARRSRATAMAAGGSFGCRRPVIFRRTRPRCRPQPAAAFTRSCCLQNRAGAPAHEIVSGLRAGNDDRKCRNAGAALAPVFDDDVEDDASDPGCSPGGGGEPLEAGLSTPGRLLCRRATAGLCAAADLVGRHSLGPSERQGGAGAGDRVHRDDVARRPRRGTRLIGGGRIARERGDARTARRWSRPDAPHRGAESRPGPSFAV